MTEKVKTPTKNSWCWVLIKGYKKAKPCWFSLDEDDEEDSYFLAGGMGDGSSCGIYVDSIAKIGSEIIEPEL